MATKRKHNEVTLKVKYEVLKELKKGKPNKDIANQFSIPSSTLAIWKETKKNLDADGLIDFDREVATIESRPLPVDEIVHEYLQQPVETVEDHHHHEMKLTRQLKS